MVKKTIMSMMFWLAFISFVQAGSGPDLNEGKWEITVDLEMPGMPAKMPPTTYTQCIRKEQAVPKEDKPGQQCTAKDIVTKGNTVSWTLVCNNPGGRMTGKGKVTYHKDRMDGTMTMEGQGMTMTSRFKGRRIGECQ